MLDRDEGEDLGALNYREVPIQPAMEGMGFATSK